MNHFSSCGNSGIRLLSVLRGRPQTSARIAGGESCPEISGTVRFYQTSEGVIIRAEINGLPLPEHPCQERIFGFHIHKGTDCWGNMDDPFANAMSHYDPRGCEHPYHAGELGTCLWREDRAGALPPGPANQARSASALHLYVAPANAAGQANAGH